MFSYPLRDSRSSIGGGGGQTRNVLTSVTSKVRYYCRGHTASDAFITHHLTRVRTRHLTGVHGQWEGWVARSYLEAFCTGNGISCIWEKHTKNEHTKKIEKYRIVFVFFFFFLFYFFIFFSSLSSPPTFFSHF